MDRRDQIALAFALVAHAAIFLVARQCSVRGVVPAPLAPPQEVAIEIEPAAPEPAEPRAESTRGSDGEPRAIGRASVPTPPLARAAAATSQPLASLSPPSVPSSAPPESAPTAAITPASPAPSRPAVTLAQLGLEGPNPFLAAAPSSAPPAAALEGVNRSIADSLLKHDRNVGLGLEGPAIAVIEEAVFRSTSSVNGRAVLSVVADANGVVTGVSCVDGDHAQWDALAREIAALLHEKRLRTAPGGHGVEMRIEVTSREEVPSGRDPGLEVDLLHVPGAKPLTLKKGRGPKSSKVSLLDVNPKIVLDDPNADESDGPPTAAAARFPIAHIQVVDIAKVELDPIDIGAKARRVVHAKVLQEHPL